jgi:hypothetical protein
MSKVPVPEKRNSADSLENFAKRIEERLRIGKGGSFAMERLVCRLLAGQDRKVAAMMAGKWTEWRYGKATEHLHMTGSVIHEHVDTSHLSDAQLAEAEALIESAHVGSDQG